jgi:Ser/Thr protein kinase RdoA (MazF antagonist)
VPQVHLGTTLLAITPAALRQEIPAAAKMDWMLPHQDLWSVLSFYALRPEFVRQVEPVSGGWSGSRLWKVTDEGGGEFCLRRWPPEHPTPERLTFIHAILRRVAVHLLVVPAPLFSQSGATFHRHAGHLWDLAPWMPGEADFHSHPTRGKLLSAMHTLAGFHIAAADRELKFGPAPAWLDRQRAANALVSGGLQQIEAAVKQPLDPALDTLARRLLPLARDALQRDLAAPLRTIPPAVSLQPAIRDIHHDHVLFTGDEVTGIIDFGALRIDTPLADVARLVGSLVGDDRDNRQLALDTYAELRPLSETDRQFVDRLDETGLILSAFNWLRWLYVERRDMGESSPIVRRLDEILARLERRAKSIQ